MKSPLASLCVGAALSLLALAGCTSGGGGRCANGVLDPIETDVDCGGFCGPCAGGLRCAVATDCATLDCVGGVCAASAASCSDGRTNGFETDVDCGGSSCPACSATRACVVPSDCISESCEAGACAVPASCSDATLSPGESDVDCGGPCLPCGNGKSCHQHSECLSATCTFGVCAAPSCDDGVLNQAESAIDCGGPCDPCQLGQNCGAPTDCVSAACEGGTCCAPNACGFCGASPPDVCDGFDNDCDGQTDGADEIGAAPACDKQDGVCGGASARCGGEVGWVCDDSDYSGHDARYEAQELSCDGVDNDCDGKTDEGEHMPNQPLCAEQRGVCAGAVAPCHGAAGATCTAADYADHSDDYEASETLCDGLDNDCDGQTDEGLRNACGACAAAPVELCDGLDNDCDGLTDETPQCAACTASPVAITDATLPRQENVLEEGGAAFALQSGRMCGFFHTFGRTGVSSLDTRSVFYCVDGGTPSVFYRHEDVVADSVRRTVAAAVPLGDDVVYHAFEGGLSSLNQVDEIHRLTTGGVDTDISASFPRLGPDDEISIASSGGTLYVLAYPRSVSSTAGMTLTTYTSGGAVSSQTIAGTGFSEAYVIVGRGGAAQPTVAYHMSMFGDPADTWLFWRGGSQLTSRPKASGDFVTARAADAAGGLHFVRAGGWQLPYQRFAQGSWSESLTVGEDAPYYSNAPTIALGPDGAPWIVIEFREPQDQFTLIPVVPGQIVGPVSQRFIAPAQATRATGLIVDAEPRAHVFYGEGHYSDLAPETAAVWGYYMQICPGFSDSE
ncbi:MAG: hypothetical protein CVU56_22950 [Deltaproteobacteria bacterium HGW-Deltaproteobacteria-14]|jgi:hypothetical protein|nr:MAG: hypothetical protein CVU56_22950 [Deltaproteobacteria bacterium HGW-Deltaproteobacteria-14]